MKFYFLGTGNGIPNGVRFCSSILIETEQVRLLVDCGAPVSTLLPRQGVDLDTLNGIIITHFHTDHVLDLPLMIKQMSFFHRKEKLTIFGPPSIREWFYRQYRSFIHIPEDICFPIEFRSLQDLKHFVFSDLILEPFSTQHLKDETLRQYEARYPDEMDLAAFGFRLRNNASPLWIAFSGDVASNEDIASDIYGAHTLIHEFGHVTLDHIAKMAKKAEVKRLIVTHIHHDWSARAEEIHAYLKPRFSGEILIPSDGDVLLL